MAHWTACKWVGDPGNFFREEYKHDDKLLGEVMWFFTGGPYYPHTLDKRFGAFDDIDAARRKVEEHATPETDHG